MKTATKINRLCMMALGCIILFLSSCKKSETQQLLVTAQDLTGYYIPIELKNNSNNRVNYELIYFLQDGDGIKTYYDAPSARRIRDAVVTDNTLSMDLDANGVSIFHFAFEKNRDGTLALKSFSHRGTADYSMVHAELVKIQDVPGWGDQTFLKSSGPAAYLPYYQFRNNGTQYTSYDEDAGIYLPYKDCYPLNREIGFKDNDHTRMGIFVPSWKGDHQVRMLLYMSGTGQLGVYKYN